MGGRILLGPVLLNGLSIKKVACWLSISFIFIFQTNSQSKIPELSDEVEDLIRKDDVAGLIAVAGPCVLVLQDLEFRELTEELPFLHFAVSVGANEIVKWAVKNRININQQDSIGRFAGEIAIVYGQDKILEILGETGLTFSDQSIFCFFTRTGGVPVRKVGGVELKSKVILAGLYRDVDWELKPNGSVEVSINDYEKGTLAGRAVGRLVIQAGYFVFETEGVFLR